MISCEPSINVNVLEEDGMLADWNLLPIETPHLVKGLWSQYGKGSLPREGNAEGI
jgi:hypothetical protein